MMKMVSLDEHIYRCVHLNSANFRTCQILFIVDMMNMIILNDGKHTAQMPDNTGLSAIMNITTSYNVASDVFLCPSFPLRLTNSITLRLSTVLELFLQPFIIIFRLKIFPQ